jgi:hypothetical protein
LSGKPAGFIHRVLLRLHSRSPISRPFDTLIDFLPSSKARASRGARENTLGCR